MPTTQVCCSQLAQVQAGNDFLPNVPSLEIYDRPSALDTLLGAYRAVLVAAGNYVTSAGKINPDRLRRLLAKLAEDEEVLDPMTSNSLTSVTYLYIVHYWTYSSVLSCGEQLYHGIRFREVKGWFEAALWLLLSSSTTSGTHDAIVHRATP